MKRRYIKCMHHLFVITVCKVAVCGMSWQMRGSAVTLQNGGVSGGGRVTGGPRVRKHTSVSVDSLDDVCFKSTSAFR